MDLAESVDNYKVGVEIVFQGSELLLDQGIGGEVAGPHELPPDVGGGVKLGDAGLDKALGGIQLKNQDAALLRGAAKEGVSTANTAGHLPCQRGFADTGFPIQEDNPSRWDVGVDQEGDSIQVLAYKVSPGDWGHAPSLSRGVGEGQIRGGQKHYRCDATIKLLMGAQPK